MPNEFITSETKSLLRFIDANGNEVIVYPITRAELIAGLTEWSESEGNTPNWANVLGKPEVLDGKDGATWYEGTAAPAESTGKEGDFYLNTANGDVYKRTANGWGSPLGNLTGPQGKPGEDGAPGKNGSDGAPGKDGQNGKDGRGIASAEINGEKKLILHYTDETQDDLGVVVGADGKDGAAGKDGTPGTPGRDGQNGVNGADGKNGTTFTPHVSAEGVLTWTNDGSLPNPDPVTIKGADGANGKDGAPGSPGQNGENGAPGKDGKDGTTFTPSVSEDGDLSWSNDGEKQNPPTVNIKGKDGKDGAPGTPGKNGENGAPGANGKDGRGIASAEINGENKLIIHYTDETQDDLGVVVGADGAPGTPGKNGENGAPGANGKDGAAGKDGATWYSGATAPSGSTGQKGDFYLDTTTGDVYNRTESGWGSPVCNLIPKKPMSKIYGVSGMGSVTPVWQRTYDAAGVTLSLTNQSGNSNLVNFVLSDNAMQEFFHFQETTDENGNVFLVIPPLAFRYDRINENEVEALSVKLYEDGDEQFGFELHPAFRKWTSNTEYSGYGNIQIAKYLSAPLDTTTRSAAEGDVSSRNVNEIKVRSVKGENYTLSYASWNKGLQIIKATDASYRMLHWSYRDLIVKLATIFFARSDIYNMLDLEDGCELDPTTGTTDAIQSHSGFNRTTSQMKLFGIDAAFDATTINGVYQNSDRSVYYTHLLDTDAETASGYTKSDLTVPVSYSGDNYSGPITKISVDAHERALGFPSANIHLPVGEEASEKKNHSTYYSSKYYDWGAPSSRGQVWAFQKYLSGDGGTLFTDNGLFFVSWFNEFYVAWYYDDGGALRLCKEAS